MTELLQIMSVTVGQVPAELANADPDSLGAGAGFQSLVSIVRYVAFAVLLIAMIGAGAMMAISSRRGEGSEHLSRIGWVFGGAIVVASATSLVNAFI